MATNLPANVDISDLTEKTKLIFNNLGTTSLEFNAVEVDATIAFFTKRKFSNDAANAVATLLLTQAKKEKISVMSILDSINAIDSVQLSVFVSSILNNDRVQTSTLGFRRPVIKSNQTRNIVE